MKKQITISYQNRTGATRDYPASPKITLANHLIKGISGFSIGDKVMVNYSLNQIIITKVN
jgi:hypothetical protein